MKTWLLVLLVTVNSVSLADDRDPPGWECTTGVDGKKFCTPPAPKTPLVPQISSYRKETGKMHDAEIVGGGQLELSGMALGDLYVEQNGHLIVSGIVQGTVINKGGLVEINGVVHNLDARSGRSVVRGIVERISRSNGVQIVPGAIVNGMRR